MQSFLRRTRIRGITVINSIPSSPRSSRRRDRTRHHSVCTRMSFRSRIGGELITAAVVLSVLTAPSCFPGLVNDTTGKRSTHMGKLVTCFTHGLTKSDCRVLHKKLIYKGHAHHLDCCVKLMVNSGQPYTCRAIDFAPTISIGPAS